MKKIRPHLISITLLLTSVFLFLVIIEKLCIDQYLFALLHSLKPFLIACGLVFFIQPLILKGSYFSYKVRTCLIYSGIGFVLVFVLVCLSFYVYVKKEELLFWGNQIIQESSMMIQKSSLQRIIFDGQIKQKIAQFMQWLMEEIKNSVNGLSVISFSFIIAFFISIEMPLFSNEFKKYIKNHEAWVQFYILFSDVFLKYCASTLIDALYIVGVTSLILYLFHTPAFLLLSVILAILNLFPYIGAVIGTVLILLVHAMTHQEHLILLAFVLLISSQIESDMIHPLIFKKTMNVHPLFLFLAMVINDFLFGLVGVVLSPILAAFIQMGVKSYMETLNQSGMGGWEELR